MDDDRDLISIGPEKTYALIVGINYYPQLSSDWQLRNPVSEARRVACWLLERGVPASHIQCFLAPSATEATEPLRDRDGQELQCQRPTIQRIQAALLETRLPELPEQSTLIFFWAGHGQLGQDSKQLLYDADYTEQIPRLYDFTEIKRALASERWARLTRQILLVNACANLDTKVDQKFDPLSLPVKGPGNNLLRRQFVVYSSPPGEYAKDGEEGRPSPFFEKVFGALQRLGDRGPFPEEELTRQIDETIEAMRPRPRTERITFGSNSKQWCPVDDLTRLIHSWLSQEIDVSLDRFQEIFRRWFNDQKGDPTSIADLVRRLVSQPVNQIKNPLGRVVGFFLHAVLEFGREDLFERLQDVIKRPNQYGLSGLSEELTLPGLRRVRQDIERDRAAGRPPFYLSFYLTSGEDTAEFLYCIVHDGQFNKIGDHRMEIERREKVEETFRKFYKETIDVALRGIPGYRNVQDSDVHFRFYLPAEAMNQLPVHRFLDPRRNSNEITIAQYSPLTLASFERASGKSGPDSLRRWEFLFGRNARVVGIEATYQSISPDWSDIKRHKEVERHHWLGFDHPPTLERLIEMVDLGAPFLIWPWQATGQWPEVQKSLTTLIGTTTSLGEAHTRLPDFRSEYPRETDQLVVFWDDYERNGLKHLQVEEFPLMFGE